MTVKPSLSCPFRFSQDVYKRQLNVLGRLLVSGHAVGLCSARGFQDVGTLLSDVYKRQVIYPRMKVIPELTRNGFKGVFYDICPRSFFMTLLTDNQMEILYKAGHMNLFLRFLERKYGMDTYWTYVKICLRQDYVIHDADLWLDVYKRQGLLMWWHWR